MINDADKTSHSDIIKNPDIQELLNNCDYIKAPSEDELKKIKDLFIEFNRTEDEISQPENIISIDATSYESSVHESLPFTNMGYIKLSNFLIKKQEYFSQANSRFVDPFQVAKLNKQGEFFSFAFPGNNISYKKQSTLRDGFRLALEESLVKYKTIDGSKSFTLRDTLFWLSSYKRKELNTIKLQKCPCCGQEDVILYNFDEQQHCPNCTSVIYASDCLRIWEEIDENSTSNQKSLTRMVNVIKHLTILHYIHVIKESNQETYLATLNKLCFFVNGALAIFGPPAWLHGAIMNAINDINIELRKHGYSDLLIIGISESGHINDYFNLFKDVIKNDTFFCIGDDFRIKFLGNTFGNTFGNETYYGQDFVFKTNNQLNVFNIPYPFSNKSPINTFKTDKALIKNYNNILTVLQLINDCGCELYKSALIPVVLAKKYTVISLDPGAKMLDLLSKANIIK